MMALKVRIRRQRSPDVMLRQWNAWVREAYIIGGRFWVETFLPLHFSAGAVQRYQYGARTRRYLDRKRYAPWMRDWKGKRFTPVRPPLPLVLTGAARRELTKPASAFNIRAAATSNKQFVKVPLRLPHPMNPRHAGELTRIVREESKALGDAIFYALRAVIKNAEIQTFLSSVD